MSAPGLRDRLQAGLRAAMKAKNPVAVAAIRSALAAVANAEAVDAGTTTTASAHVAGGVVGVGAGDVPRRRLTELDVLDAVDAEVTDRRDHASEYDALGRPDAAERLRAEAAVLESFLAG